MEAQLTLFPFLPVAHCPNSRKHFQSLAQMRCVFSAPTCQRSTFYSKYTEALREADVGSLSAIRGCVGGSRWGAITAAY